MSEAKLVWPVGEAELRCRSAGGVVAAAADNSWANAAVAFCRCRRCIDVAKVRRRHWLHMVVVVVVAVVVGERDNTRRRKDCSSDMVVVVVFMVKLAGC